MKWNLSMINLFFKLVIIIYFCAHHKLDQLVNIHNINDNTSLKFKIKNIQKNLNTKNKINRLDVGDDVRICRMGDLIFVPLYQDF